MDSDAIEKLRNYPPDHLFYFFIFMEPIAIWTYWRIGACFAVECTAKLKSHSNRGFIWMTSSSKTQRKENKASNWCIDKDLTAIYYNPKCSRFVLRRNADLRQKNPRPRKLQNWWIRETAEKTCTKPLVYRPKNKGRPTIASERGRIINARANT